jgi:hypothetical protein
MAGISSSLMLRSERETIEQGKSSLRLENLKYDSFNLNEYQILYSTPVADGTLLIDSSPSNHRWNPLSDTPSNVNIFRDLTLIILFSD